MKSLIVFVSLLLVTGAFAGQGEATRYDLALAMIAARNDGKTCENSAYEDTIIEMAARGVADDPAGLENFTKSIPAKSDILQNLLFRALLKNTDLSRIADARVLEDLANDTKYYSKSGGVYGHAYSVELKSGGQALITQGRFKGDKFVVKTLKGHWQASVEIEPGADYYQFIKVTIGSKAFDYMLKQDVTGGYEFELINQPAQPAEAKEMIFSPSECGD